MSDLANVKVLVHGRVQGVYYRAFTARIAKSLSITGWVRNSQNGNVEAELEGERETLNKMLNHLSKGPDGAVVKKIDQVWSDYTGQFKAFDVRY